MFFSQGPLRLKFKQILCHYPLHAYLKETSASPGPQPWRTSVCYWFLEPSPTNKELRLKACWVLTSRHDLAAVLQREGGQAVLAVHSHHPVAQPLHGQDAAPCGAAAGLARPETSCGTTTGHRMAMSHSFQHLPDTDCCWSCQAWNIMWLSYRTWWTAMPHPLQHHSGTETSCGTTTGHSEWQCHTL